MLSTMLLRQVLPCLGLGAKESMSSLTGLPATAQQAVAAHLRPADTFSCALASRDLAAITAAGQPGCHLQVVATAFQQQLKQEQDEQQQAAAATGGAATEAGGASPQASNGSRQMPAASGKLCAALQQRAAVCPVARVAVDVKAEFDQHTFEQLFSALASSQVQHLTVTEYSQSCDLDPATRKAMELRGIRADMGSQPAEAAPAGPLGGSSSSRGSSADWLPALVAAFEQHRQLTGLSLLLLAPLPLQHQPLLLWLTGLSGLSIAKTPPELCGFAAAVPEPALLPSAVGQLSLLTRLRALSASIAPAGNGTTDGQVAVVLQQLFSSAWGASLTQLSFGTAARATQLSLSAPLRGMKRLADLTCRPGFTLDAEDIIEDDAGLMAVAAAGPARSASAPSQQQEEQQLVPSLTRLVVNEGSNHSDLLHLLAAHPASAAASQLRHLELNSPGMPLPCSSLARLCGLQQLRLLLDDPEGLPGLAASGACKQLRGLTLLFSVRSWVPGSTLSLVQAVVEPLAQLTALSIHGSTGASDLIALVAASQQLPQLQQLRLSGKLDERSSTDDTLHIPALPPKLCELSLSIQSSFGASSSRKHYVLDPAHQWPTCLSRLQLLGVPAVMRSLQQEHGQLVAGMSAVAVSGSAGGRRGAAAAACTAAAGVTVATAAHVADAPLQQLELCVSALEHWQQLRRPGLVQLSHLALHVQLGSKVADCSTSELPEVAASLHVVCPQLVSLKLAWTGNSRGAVWPSDELLVRIMPILARLTSLEELSLQSPYICSDAASALDNLSTLTRLQQLHCDVPLTRLTQALGLASIVSTRDDTLFAFRVTSEREAIGLEFFAPFVVQPSADERAAAISSLASSLQPCIRLRRLTLHATAGQDVLLGLQHQLRNCLVTAADAKRMVDEGDVIGADVVAAIWQPPLA